MENNHLTYFKIENFKKFDSLEVNDIGQFNLIVGGNNVGKTCLLEALLLEFHAKKILATLHYTFYKRKIIIDKTLDYPINKEDFNFNFNLIGLSQNDRNKHISFVKKVNAENEKKFEIENLKEFNPLTREDTKKFIEDVDLFQYKNINQHSKNWLIFKLKKENSLTSEIVFLADVTSSYYKDFYDYLDELPIIKIDDLYSDDLIQHYQQIVKNPKDEEKLINLIQKIYPELIINRFSIFDSFNKNEYLHVSTNKRVDYHPVNEYGDGLIRILRIIFEILVNEKSYVVIDEIEIGIHHSKIKNFWKNIILVCKELNVQLFASTHSEECIEAYCLALEELNLNKKGKVVLLQEEKENIVSYTFETENLDLTFDYRG